MYIQDKYASLIQIFNVYAYLVQSALGTKHCTTKVDPDRNINIYEGDSYQRLNEDDLSTCGFFKICFPQVSI